MPTLPKLPLVKVVPLWKAQQILCDKGDRDFFQSVISIGYDAYEKEPEGFYSFTKPKIRLNVNDTQFPHQEGAPKRKDIQSLIDFMPKVTGPLLIHCHAGKSRSTAAMLIYYATKLGIGRHKEVIDLWYNHVNSGTPNCLMVAHADHILGFDRKLFDLYLEASDKAKYETLQEIYDLAKSP